MQAIGGGDSASLWCADGERRSPELDAQFAEFIEVIWACERAWALEERIDTAIRYGR